MWSEEAERFGSEPQLASNQRSAVNFPPSHPLRMKCATAATLALFALVASARDEKPCTVHDKGGTYYDLNKLSAK